MFNYNNPVEVLIELRGIASKRRTICEVFREMYDLTDNNPDPEMQKLIIEGFIMAKKMNDKLVEYKNAMNPADEGIPCEPNLDAKEDVKNRQKHMWETIRNEQKKEMGF